MEAPEYLDLDEIDFSDDISVSITTYKQCFHTAPPSSLRADSFILTVFPQLPQPRWWTENKLRNRHSVWFEGGALWAYGRLMPSCVWAGGGGGVQDIHPCLAFHS